MKSYIERTVIVGTLGGELRQSKSDQEDVSTRADRRYLELETVDDDGDAGTQTFKQRLLRHFINRDVWGVIAATTARNTPSLLSCLGAIDVVVFLVVDSVVKLEPGSAGSNILRLAPNNARQAQAILGALTHLGQLRPADLVCLEPGDRYVEDLCATIHTQAATAHGSPSITRVLHPPTGRRQERCLLFVGYGLPGKQPYTPPPRPFTLYCDGFQFQQSLPSTTKLNTADRVYSVRPGLRANDYAAYAYKAVCDAWRLNGCAGLEWDGPGVVPATKLKPYSLCVRNELERISDHFLFHGAENLRGGYVVEEITNIVTRRQRPK